MTPIRAFISGLVAGAFGSLAQNVFFSLTEKRAPQSPKNVFQPPEDEQKNETATQTVARRFVEDFVERGPLIHKGRAGNLVHYAFGSAWGGGYGLLAGSTQTAATPLGALAFGLLVWGASDNLLLPVFRLAAWPRAYPMRNHVYAVLAHCVYGAAVWGAFSILTSAGPPGPGSHRSSKTH